MKPRLLVLELWGLGDLVIATQFLRAAGEAFDVTLVAKPFGRELQPRLWPGVRVHTLVAPWTAFRGKYRLWLWPWRQLLRMTRELRAQRFDVGVSGRWDPRDHAWLRLVGARERIGFPRLGSQRWLTRALPRPDPEAHRYEYWRALGRALGLDLPPREALAAPPRTRFQTILVHTGAGQPVRVWPLQRYRELVQRLRSLGWRVRVACDPQQRQWWVDAGEVDVVAPQTVAELLRLIDAADLFIGNDSGPGHLAACCGLPTFTLFGPQLPEWFAPLHPRARWIEGRPCPFKPCSDYCRWPRPVCLENLRLEEVWAAVVEFLQKTANATVRPSGRQISQT